jgi:branched-subunit amino acid aminotransferase/4-amino-4-deoxychorismate lyase
MSALRVLVENGIRLSSVPSSTTTFILESARGAYSGARTFESTRIWLLDLHLARLATSYSAIAQRSIDVTRVRSLVLPSVRLAVRDYLAEANAAGVAAHELKVTMLMSVSSSSTSPAASADACPDVRVYVEPQPIRKPPIAVEVRQHAPRDQPNAKDTEWVRQREELERAKARDVDEVVMYAGDDLAVSEGLSSNFAVIIDGAIHTPRKETVLFGTVFQLIERLCAAHSLPLVIDGVSVRDRARWQAAFIASTTRGLLPVDELRFPDLAPSEGALRLATDLPILATLRKLISDEMRAESTEVVAEDVVGHVA